MKEDKIWKIRSEKKIFTENLFEIFELECFLPSKGIEHKFLSIHLHDWINVFAMTAGGEVILVKQHRVGKDQVTIEVPAGAVHKGEDPKTAAVRELEEETGHTSDNIVLLKKISVNPAIQDNTCYFYLALDCRKCKETNFDTAEEIEVLFKSKEEVFALIDNDRMDNSLSFLSVMLAREYLMKKGK